jgi:S-DNA-T family DNA segregation ATPase FtsK/SpoIIIE
MADKPAPKKKESPAKTDEPKGPGFWKDARTHTVGGLLLIIFSVVIFLSCLSYLINGFADQSELYNGWDNLGRDLWSEEQLVQNWMGWAGAAIGHALVYSSFGLAAFVFPFFLFNLGVRVMLRVALVPMGKAIWHSLFFLYFTPLVTGTIAGGSTLAAGAAGISMSRWAQSVMGYVGTWLAIATVSMIYSVIVFGITGDMIKALIPEGKKKEEPEEENSNDEKIAAAAVTAATLGNAPAQDAVADQTIRTNEIDLTLLRNGKGDIAIPLQPAVTEELPITDNFGKEDNEDGPPWEEVDNPGRTESVEDVEFTVVVKEEKVEAELFEEPAKGSLDTLYDPTLDLSNYKYPPLDMLREHGSNEISVNKDELETNKNRIVQTLNNYGIDIDKIKATIGPTVTLYEIVPAPGVRISKIKNLEDDIALSLSALGIRIIAPIPGKGTIGIEVPNLNPDVVSMRTVLASDKFQHAKMDLPIALGKTISNETFVTDLTKMPHLLMAGATGQGKSVGLNAILTSILYKKHPSQVKLVLVDPKKVELTLFSKIERHFLAKLPDADEAIITDTQKVVNTLNSLCIEMDTRYEHLKDAQVRNIKEYNEKFVNRKLNPKDGHKYLPYIVVVIDEFADLIMTAGKEVELPIARIAQLARAVGIHLIIATQRPSVNIITGTIKANFPARIAFRVSAKVDSRTILDSGGADQLIGRGDMLLSTGNDLIRIQCAFIDTPEVDEITEFIGAQQGYPDAFMLPEYVPEGGSSDAEAFDPSERDAMFSEAAHIVVQHQQGSASLLQRRLKLGYNRAGRLIDQLEAAGIIGPFEGSKARQVLFADGAALEQYLSSKGLG